VAKQEGRHCARGGGTDSRGCTWCQQWPAPLAFEGKNPSDYHCLAGGDWGILATIMNRRALLSVLVLVLAGGCKKKEPPAENTPTPGSGSAVATGSGGSAGIATGSGSAVAEAPKGDPKLVERGAYLVNMLGCPFCHMPMGPKGPDFSRPFAGGMEVPEVFGTWVAPNITPHKGSGIGNWTDEQIIAAVREGVRPDGSSMYPIMPFMNYNRMTDDDAKALVAYLRTVPPVDNVVPRTKDLKMPKMMAPTPANLPDELNDPLKHGEYLVTLMHCNVCHTPMTARGPDMGKQFAGGMEFEIPFLGTGKLYGQNITSDPETGIGKWTEADIAKSVKTMTRPDGTIIQGPMQFYLAGWSKLEDSDLAAIAKFIKQIAPIKNKVAGSTFKPAMGPPPGAGGGSADAGGAGSSGGSAAAGSGSAAPAAPTK